MILIGTVGNFTGSTLQNPQKGEKEFYFERELNLTVYMYTIKMSNWDVGITCVIVFFSKNTPVVNEVG